MIKELVSNLPELYQPIYEHPELSDRVSRIGTDRLQDIFAIYDALSNLLNRPLKVLDLGCAQGYFSLNLAQRGAIVLGIDYLDENIDVCHELAREHTDFNIKFEKKNIEDVANELQDDSYDIVLGLSVFHHIIYGNGVDYVKNILNKIAVASKILVLELAVREEGVYWSSALPEEPENIIEDFHFYHEVSKHKTHLTEISRPIYVASNNYWVIGDHAERFNTFLCEPHFLAKNVYQGTRRYYFSEKFILKKYRYIGPLKETNQKHFENESNFLRYPPFGFLAPKIIEIGQRKSEAWLAMERLPGILLSEILRDKLPFNKKKVIDSILLQLITLEENGLYHDDVRAWNILVTEDSKATIIDYGSISSQKKDCVWPNNIFLSFFILIKEIITGDIGDPNPLRLISISPFSLQSPYCDLLGNLVSLHESEFSYKTLYNILHEKKENKRDLSFIEIWMKSIEEAIEILKIFSHATEGKLESIHLAALKRTEQAELRAEQAELRAEQAELRAEQAEVQNKKIEEIVEDIFCQIENIKKNSFCFKIKLLIKKSMALFLK